MNGSIRPSEIDLISQLPHSDTKPILVAAKNGFADSEIPSVLRAEFGWHVSEHEVRTRRESGELFLKLLQDFCSLGIPSPSVVNWLWQGIDLMTDELAAIAWTLLALGHPPQQAATELGVTEADFNQAIEHGRQFLNDMIEGCR